MVYNSMRMWQGANGISKYDGIVSPAYTVLCATENVDYNYMASLFKTPQLINEFRKNSQGLTSDTWNLKYPQIAPINIFVPQFTEQQKIGNFLKIIDNRIEKQQALVETLKLYKRGVLNKLFNEYEPICLKTIGELSNVFSGGTPRAGVSEYYGGSIPFIRSGEIHNDKTELFLTEKGLKNSSAKMVEKGDLLFALYGATSGEVSISQINGAINQAILCIRPHSDITAQFLQIYLEYSKDAIISKLLQGGQGNLSGELVKGLTIPIFDINAQKTITNVFTAINNKINAFELYLFNLYKFKNGLLQQMFI